MRALIGVSAIITIVCADTAYSKELSVSEARALVVGREFAFRCFEGTTGQGTITEDGAVAGSIQIRGRTPAHHVTLPPSTIRERSGKICASVPGLSFDPCFSMQQTNARGFRGSVIGLEFAACEFTQLRASPDPAPTRSSGLPLRIQPQASK
jgi:hypothetical protein